VTDIVKPESDQVNNVERIEDRHEQHNQKS
jgi:hypothetical protein